MVVSRITRSIWIEAGLRALASGGPDAVRVEALARTLGVTKGSFYWHFDNRHTLLNDILDTWERVSVDEAIERIEAKGGDGADSAKSKLKRLSALAFYSDEALGTDPLGVDLAIRDWARRDEKIARRLRRVDNRRMNYLRSLFSVFCADEAETEDRCLLVLSLWIGSHFIVADHPGRSRAAVMEGAFQRLLEA